MSKTIVGKLYMNGCGHCDALEEPWNQMKNKVGGKVTVADDIEAEETDKLDKLNKQHEVNVVVQGGYPTIYKIKKGGKVEYYDGERTEQELVNWALKMSAGSKSRKRTQSRKRRQSRKKQRR